MMYKKHPWRIGAGFYVFLLVFLLTTANNNVFAANGVVVSGSNGVDGAYPFLKAAFDAINTGPAQTGRNIEVTITASTIEPGTVVLNQGAWTTLKVYPTVSGLSISGSVASNALIDLNGPDNVIFDGRVNQLGSIPDLTIINTSTSSNAGTSTIRYINDASLNQIKYCNVRGSTACITAGIFFFSTATGTGNDNNTVEYCNITTASDANRPVNVFYFSGTLTKPNNSTTINANNIYDFISRSSNSNGINVLSDNVDLNITGNSFYETNAFNATVGRIYKVININNTSSGNVVIDGNYIGGNAPSANGSWLKTGSACGFTGISFNGQTGVFRNNHISNIDWRNTVSGANFTCVELLAGNITFGSNGQGNIIGSATTTQSIKLINNTGGYTLKGLYVTSSGTTSCAYNSIGSLYTGHDSPLERTNIVALHITNSAGVSSVLYNSIGSSVVENSIYASSLATSPSLSSGQYVLGLWMQSPTEYTVSGNSIKSLTNSSSFAAASLNDNSRVIGCYIQSTNASNQVFKSNFIMKLNGYYAVGVYNNLGATRYYNNVISIVLDRDAKVYGFYDDCIDNFGGILDFQFNTIYLGGSPASPTLGSVCFASQVTKDNTIIKSNQFYNGVVNPTALVYNYAFYTLQTPEAGETYVRSFNNYYVLNNTIDVLAYYAGVKNSLGAINDALSYSCNPSFINPGGLVATDYKFQVPIPGENTGFGDDFLGVPRTATFSNIGAFEDDYASNFIWTGVVSSEYANVNNWYPNSIPNGGSSILFLQDNLTNVCRLTGDVQVNNVFVHNFKSPVALFYLNGFKLSLSGTLIGLLYSGIDASDVNSTLSFNGVGLQVVSSSSLLNGSVYTLDVNNASNVQLSGTWTVLGSLTATSGKFDATTSTPTIVMGGSATQNIGDVFTGSNSVYNLTINNNPVYVNSDLLVSNVLVVNAGKQIVVPPTKQLKVNGSVTNNAGVYGIMIQSDAAVANGTFIFNGAAPSASVGFYSKAEIVGGNKKWQYFGVPAGVTAVPVFSNSYLRKWNETYDSGVVGSRFWDVVGSTSSMVPGDGYEICNTVPTTYLIQGTLTNSTLNKTLSYTNTATATYKGNHIVANPYTAAIDIAALENAAGADQGLGANITHTVWLYSTGSLADYTANSGGTADGSLAGQYLAVPFATAGTGGLPSTIPSMQGFLVRNTAATTMSIPYSSVYVKKNTELQRAKRSEDKVYTVVDVKGSTYADKMWLFTEPSCTRGYDAGWDGEKMIGNLQAPQIYASEQSGDYQVNSVDDINNTVLGFMPGTETTDYTMTFNHSASSNYSGLYLTDLATGIVTDISASGSSYRFSSTPLSSPKRFVINKYTLNNSLGETVADETVVCVNKRIFINGLPDVKPLMLSLYDVSGKQISIFDLSQQNDSIEVLGFQDGVYLYSLLLNDKTLREGQLIVK